MADDKKISITITSQADTAGFQQATDAAKETKDAVQDLSHGGMPGLVPPGAVEEIKEVGKAIEEVGGKSPAIDPVEKALASIDEKAGKAQDSIDDLNESLSKGDEATGDIGKNVETIGRVQRFQVFAELARQAGDFGRKMQEAAKDAEGLDPELAKVMRSAGETTEAISSVGMAMATGWSVAGPWGAALAGAGQGAALMAGDVLEAGKAALIASKEFEQSFDTMISKLGEAGAAREAAAWKEWIKGLKAEEEAISTQNELLAANVELIKARADAQAKLDQANANKAKAEIDADPSLDAGEKIRRKAAIDEEMAKRGFERDDATKRGEVDAADLAAKQKREAAARAAQDAEAARVQREREDAEQRELEKVQKQKEQIRKNQLPGAEKDAQMAEEKAGKTFWIPWLDARNQADAEAKRQQAEELKNASYSNPQDEKRLEELRKNEQMRKEQADQLAAEAQQQHEAALQAQREASQKRSIYNETSPIARAAFEAEAGGRAVRTDAEIQAANTRADEEAMRKQEAEEKRREDERRRKEAEEIRRERAETRGDGVTRRAGALASTAGRDAVEIARKAGVAGSMLERLESAADAANRNPNEVTLGALERLLEVLIPYLQKQNGGRGNNDTQRLQTVERGLEAAVNQIKALSGRVK